MIFTVIGIFGIAWFLLFLWFIYLDDKRIRYFDRMKSTINLLERRIDLLEEKTDGKDEISEALEILLDSMGEIEETFTGMIESIRRENEG